MKSPSIILLLITSSIISLRPAAYADFSLEEHVIMESNISGVDCIYTADLDGDGELDMLLTSRV